MLSVQFDYQNHAQNHTHYITGHVIKSSRLSPQRSLDTRLYFSSCIDIDTGKIVFLTFNLAVMQLYYSTPVLPESKLTLDDLDRLVEELQDVREQWYNLGLQLKVRHRTLGVIRAHFKDPRDQLLEMLKTWLTSDSTSWKTLADALKSRSVNESRMADYLESKYCPMKDMDESKHYQQSVKTKMVGGGQFIALSPDYIWLVYGE